MSEQDQTSITRRRALRATAGAIGTAALAGCNGIQEDDSSSSDDSKNNSSGVTNETENNSANKKNDTEEESSENEKEKEGFEDEFEWGEILERERAETAEGIDGFENVVSDALNGENVGEDYEIGIERLTNVSYSHGGEGFDLSHFKDMNPKSKEQFYKILSDAITLGVHNRFQDLGEGASAAAQLIGDMAEQVIIGLYDDKTGNIIKEGPYDDFNLHISSSGNDGHGFNYAVTEEHGLTVVDTGSNVVGDAGDNPIQEAPYGYDIVSRYDSSWSDEDSDVPGFQANIANNFATNAFTNLGTGWNNKVAWHLDILDDVYGKLKEDGNGEFIWNKIRPAVNTLQYRYREDGDLDPESEVAALNPDNLDDLPDLRNFDEFSAYRNKLREHIEFYGPDDYIGEVNLNLGTDPVESPEISEEVGLRPNEIKELSKPLL